jgi:hypothetical protein
MRKKGKKMEPSEAERQIADRRIAANILNLDEVAEAREREQQIKKASRPSKPKRVPPWKAQYQVKTHEETDLTKEPHLISLFRSAVKNRFRDVKFIPNHLYNMETRHVSAVLDVMEASGCRDSGTIAAWIEWYVARRMRPQDVEGKWVSVKRLTDSWRDFSKIRPKGGSEKTEKPVSKPTNAIGDRLAELFSGGVVPKNILAACQLFGVTIVGNYLRGFSNDSKAVEFIAGSLDDVDDKTRRMVFEASCRYAVGKGAKKGTFLADWDKVFPVLSGQGYSRPFPAESQARYVEIFFREL